MTAADGWVASVERWRRKRDLRLRSPDGWLALVGLHWLVPGENHVGAHPSNQVVLHGHSVPPRAASLILHGTSVRLVPHDDATLTSRGAPVGEMLLLDDSEGEPTMLELGTLHFHLIRRGDRIGLRVRDHSALALLGFEGMSNYPIDPSWRLVARFEAAAPDSSMQIIDVTGARSEVPTPGSVVFERDGVSWRVTALEDGDRGELWLVFGDLTNGTQTYGGGRFVYSEPPLADGSVVVDFNLAYNPPCVFSPWATCPLPPRQNRLALRIEAGELTWHAPEGGAA